MENFFYSDKFYSDICELLEDLEISDEDVKDLPDDYILACKESILEPMVTLSTDWIMDRINEERFPEDNDRIMDDLCKAINSIDYEKVNVLIPKLYYESRVKFNLTKKDLLDYII